MSVPPPNRPGPYTYPDVNAPQVYGKVPDYVVPPVSPNDPAYVDPLAPSLIDPAPVKRLRPVPLWIPIIAVGGLVAAIIFGIASLNNQNKSPVNTPVAVITATEGVGAASPDATSQVVVIPAATSTPLIIVVTATPLPQVADQPQATPVPDQPQPTAIPQPAQPTPIPTATPRPAPTVPPVVVPPTAQPAGPTQPQPTPVPPTATTAPAPTATLPPATIVQATTAPVNPTATPAGPSPTATQVPLNSQSIGLFKTEWEKWHGQGDQRDNGLFYENQKYMVVFFEDRIVRLERLYGNTPVTLDAARAESKTFLPEDAQVVQTYIGPDKTQVDLYKSEALKTYFAGVTDPDFWKGGEPGNFIVQYRKADAANMFSAIVITLGNNPQMQP